MIYFLTLFDSLVFNGLIFKKQMLHYSIRYIQPDWFLRLCHCFRFMKFYRRFIMTYNAKYVTSQKYENIK